MLSQPEVKTMVSANGMSGAIFSTDEKYRYALWRTWDATKGNCLFIMLNPSTADHEVMDPTVTRCKAYAETWGYGKLTIANIFALRSTDPKALYGHQDPIGIDNDYFIGQLVKDAQLVVVAWGNHGQLRWRGAQVLRMIKKKEIVPHYLKINSATGEPCHPLYLSQKLKPIPMSVT